MSPFSFDNLTLVTRKKMFERFHLKVLVVFFISLWGYPKKLKIGTGQTTGQGQTLLSHGAASRTTFSLAIPIKCFVRTEGRIKVKTI